METRISTRVKNLQGPILILGGGGFVGINLAEMIFKVREDITILSHNIQNNWKFKEGCIPVEKILKLDISNKHELSNFIHKLKPQTIFNLAAYGAYSSQSEYSKIYSVNFDSTISLIEILKEEGFSAYVHAGSSSEYGTNSSAPLETSELIPNSHYAVSKVASYYALKYYGKVENLPVVHLRLYSVYGPYEEPGRLIPTLFTYALSHSYPPLVNEHITRDFVYVEDVAEGFIQAALNASIVKGSVFNIGTGKKTSIRDVVLNLKEIVGIDKKPIFGIMEKRHWDHQKDWYSDSTSALETLHWQPLFDLKTGLNKTWIWFKQHKHVYLDKLNETR